MSLKTWKLEFYPVKARTVRKEDALDHSLRKWEGLTEENLKKHGVKRIWGGFRLVCDYSPHKTMQIDGKSCALCNHYLDKSKLRPCSDCLIVKHTGHTCDWSDEEDDGGEGLSPWEHWIGHEDPQPMIDLLKSTKANFKEQS